jgi:hypothetical protein
MPYRVSQRTLRQFLRDLQRFKILIFLLPPKNLKTQRPPRTAAEVAEMTNASEEFVS